MTLGDLHVRIGANITDLQRKMGQVHTLLKKNSEDIKRIGTAMNKWVTLPLVAAAGLSVKAAIDFESAFAGVRKTVNATEAEFAGLRKGIIDMSKNLPASANEIAGVAEAAGQLGIETKNILKFSRTMVDLGETTNLTANEAATAFARFANVTQMAQDDFDRLGSAIVDLGNNFATTEKEIAELALRLAGSGKQIGLSQAAILGFAAALSSVGVEAEAGGSAFSKLFAQIQSAVSKGGKELQSFADIAGVSGTEFATTFKTDAAGAVASFIQGLGNISRAGGDTLAVLDSMEITEIRMRDAILRAANAGDLLTRSINKSSEAWTANNALSDEAAKRYATTAARLETVRNKITAAAVEIGEHLIPALESAADKAGALADAFGDMDSGSQKAVVGVGLLAAALAPLLVSLNWIVKNSKTLSLAFRGMAAVGALSLTGKGSRLDTGELEEMRSGDSYLDRVLGRPGEAEKRTSTFRKGLGLAGGEVSRVAQATGSLISKLESAGGAATVATPKVNQFNSELKELSDEAKKAAKLLERIQELASAKSGTAGLNLTGIAEEVSELNISTGNFEKTWQKAKSAIDATGVTLRTTFAPAITEVVETAKMSLADMGAVLRLNLEEIGIGAVNGLSFAIGDAVAGFESFGKAVKRIMKAVIADIVAAIAKVLILKTLMSVFGGGTGILSSIVKAVAGAGGITSGFNLPSAPSMLSSAPRPNQQPIILLRPQLTGKLAISAGELQFMLDERDRFIKA